MQERGKCTYREKVWNFPVGDPFGRIIEQMQGRFAGRAFTGPDCDGRFRGLQPFSFCRQLLSQRGAIGFGIVDGDIYRGLAGVAIFGSESGWWIAPGPPCKGGKFRGAHLGSIHSQAR